MRIMKVPAARMDEAVSRRPGSARRTTRRSAGRIPAGARRRRDANEALIRKWLDAFERRDFDAARTLFAADGLVHVLPSEPAGDYRGFDGLLERTRRQEEAGGPSFRRRVHDVLASEAHAVVLFQLHGRHGGRERDWTELAVCHIARGRVSEIWIHEAPA
jgi:ketosteroid isomerase-like protein